MKPLTAEWIQKADNDLIVAERMIRAHPQPVYDAVCFHSQQCVEKYLKACLQENDIDIPRTHKLLDLIKLCGQIDPGYEVLVPDLIIIERYSANIRYPGFSASKEEARTALHTTKAVREILRNKIG